jgi:phosphatidylserine decarboxylase
MKIHKEGYTSLFFTFLFVVGLGVLLNVIWNETTPVHYAVYVVLFLIFFTVLQFFRSPNRKLTIGDDLVISPADGKVVVIEKTTEHEFFEDERLQISVFMSPVNVHVNRYPISGIVNYFRYHPGKYLVAWHPKSSTENERTTVVVEHPRYGNVLIRQIAGALARRIVCYSKEGESAAQGAEMGFIKFGSRVDLFLPVNANVKIKIGDVVKGGQSVLASFQKVDE